MAQQVEFNLNSCVRFRPTARGIEIYKHRFDDLIEWQKQKGLRPLESLELKIDENGYAEMQFWDFMNLYGKYMYIACPSVMELNVRIDEFKIIDDEAKRHFDKDINVTNK